MYLKFASMICMLEIVYAAGTVTKQQSMDWFFGFTAGPMYFGTPITGNAASMFVYDTTQMYTAVTG